MTNMYDSTLQEYIYVLLNPQCYINYPESTSGFKNKFNKIEIEASAFAET